MQQQQVKKKNNSLTDVQNVTLDMRHGVKKIDG